MPAQNEPVVIVTGSTGLIGSALVEKITDRFNVLGLDRSPPDEEFGLDRWIHCDLTRSDSIRKALSQATQDAGREIASVIHLAAYYDFGGGDSPLYEELTVKGTERLLEELKKFKVQQFVFSSSILVMEPVDGSIKTRRITEDSSVLAKWAYPQSKLDAEHVIRERRGNIPAVIHRVAGVYDDYCNSIPLSHHIQRIFEKKFEGIFFPGNEKHAQAYIHLNDLVDAFVATIENRHSLGEEEMFLIAEPETMSHEQLQQEIGRLIHGKAWPTIRIPAPAAKVGAWAKDVLPGQDPFIKPWMVDLADDHYPIDCTHAKEVLGWQTKHSLRDTLPLMIESLKADPVSWYEAHKLSSPKTAERTAGKVFDEDSQPSIHHGNP